MDVLEEQISAWRRYAEGRSELSTADRDELEDHLRDRIADLTEHGLDAEEAFLVAVKRMGSLDALTREFAREHSERLWKQLVLAGETAPGSPDRLGVDYMLAFAFLGGLATQIPQIFGLDLENDAGFYLRNLGLFALLPLGAYLAWVRTIGLTAIAPLVALFTVGGVAANAFSFDTYAPTSVLTAIHLPIALWLAVGYAYVGGDWRSGPRRMDFIRFTGEWFIYYVLIALGGGVLTAVAVATFGAIGVDVVEFMATFVLPAGAVGAAVVAGWLVEAKQGVIENMAPVLTRVFTPLFVIALVGLLIGFLFNGAVIHVDRDALIIFDLLLVVVLGLLLYSLSAREPSQGPGDFDVLQIVLVVATLVIDLLMLVAMISRITEFGFSANKTAALGENLLLLVNLAGSAWLLLGFVRGRVRFAALEQWQTRYLTAYAAWAWAVVLLFPLVFGTD